MNDTELLGQVFMLGYFGRTPSPETLRWIGEKKIGGIKIFGWNAENLRDLTRSITMLQQEATETRLSIPLLIATDQEGGWVRHVKGETSITPGNMALGATALPYDSYYTGYYIGDELRRLGINMNFAPTVDVYSNAEAHVIGPRAFAEDPVLTANLALAYYQGTRDAGVIATAKHFPGHGSATEDSHGTLPLISTSWETLWERDLLPYRILVKNGVPAIMSSHLAFPDIVDQQTPASLSPFFLKDIIRDKLGFQGMVITDDMRMHGVLQNSNDIPEACLQAIEAGNDMIMISHDHQIHQEVWDRLYTELQKNSSFRQDLERSVERILRIKLEYLRGEEAAPLFPDQQELGPNFLVNGENDFFFNQACRSVSVIRDGLLPFEDDGRSILLAGQLNTFLRIGKEFFPGADTFHFPYSPFYQAEEEEEARLLRAARSYDTIIYLLANPNSAEVLHSLERLDKEIVVLSVLTPVYLTELPWIDTALAIYGTGRDSFYAGFAALTGMIPAYGEVPIRALRAFQGKQH